MLKTKNFKKIVGICTVFCVTSCSSYEFDDGKKYEDNSAFLIENIDKSNSTLIISNEESSGDYLAPNDYELSYTLTSLSNEKRTLIKSIQSYGEITIPVLSLHFSDGDDNLFNIINDKENLEKLFNKADESVGLTSVSEFYKASSYGKLSITFDILDVYDTKKEKNELETQSDTKDLVDDILDDLISKKEIDISKYDYDGNGKIDAMWVIPDYNYVQFSQNINKWAYTSLTSPNNKVGNVDNFSWASAKFMHYGYDYLYDPHIFIHETGHLFGLNDYYDNTSKSSPLCSLDMMDYNVLDHNSYSKMILNWKKPYIVYGNATINENEIKENNSFVVVLNDEKRLVKDDKGKYYFNPFSEYMVIDYFDYDNELNKYDLVNGYDPVNLEPNSSLSKSGYRVYHIDSRKLFLDKTNDEIEVSLFNSNIPLDSEIKGTFIDVINNNSSTSSQSPYKILNSYKSYASNIIGGNPNINYYNEITLIAKKTSSNNAYKNLYVENESGKTTLFKINNDFLYFKGDTFIPKNYINYFANSNSNDDFITMNNFSKFTTKINFN